MLITTNATLNIHCSFSCNSLSFASASALVRNQYLPKCSTSIVSTLLFVPYQKWFSKETQGFVHTSKLYPKTLSSVMTFPALYKWYIVVPSLQGNSKSVPFSIFIFEFKQTVNVHLYTFLSLRLNRNNFISNLHILCQSLIFVNHCYSPFNNSGLSCMLPMTSISFNDLRKNVAPQFLQYPKKTPSLKYTAHLFP